MNWYLIHSKPKQEKLALLNLQQQGYECFLPIILSEKIIQGKIVISPEPLFPRYLFIRLGLGETAKSWSPIRSTKGVSRLVSFGNEPAKISEQLVQTFRAREQLMLEHPRRLFNSGDRVVVTQGAFAGVEAVYQMAEGEKRALVLIELLSRPVHISLEPTKLRKVG